MLTPFGKCIRKFRIEKGFRPPRSGGCSGRTPHFFLPSNSAVSPSRTASKSKPPKRSSLSRSETRELVSAADQTRKEVKIGRLRPDQRELVAAFARRVDTATPEELEQLHRMIFLDRLKMEQVTSRSIIAAEGRLYRR